MSWNLGSNCPQKKKKEDYGEEQRGWWVHGLT
jgi:hypothetical protein